MFLNLKKQLQDNFAELSKHPLLYVDIDRDLVFEKYLTGFTEDTVQSHTCNSCKSFLRQYAGIVVVVNNQKISIWDNIIADSEYQQSVDNIKNYIHSLPITDVFLAGSKKCGTNQNKDSVRNVVWDHFYIEVPASYVNNKTADAIRGSKRTQKELLFRALKELTIDATETVLDLISQNSLYRGKEFERLLQLFLQTQKEAKDIPDLDLYCWEKFEKLGPSICSIRNTAIGTLLVDLSEDKGLDYAVGKFEDMVSGTKYKRPTALVTPKMVATAKEKLEELGLIDSLERRHAKETDLNISDILYTDKSSAVKDVFGEMQKEVLINPRTLSKVEEVSAEDFINKVVPTSKSIELLVENGHLPNFVTMLTAVEKETPSLFKWDNNFSWAYTGGITDSIKERVKQAGGNVDGELRISLSWFNFDDLDLHVIEPGGNHIYYGNRERKLDVDMNAVGAQSSTPVENICYGNNNIEEGNYSIYVNNFSKRATTSVGFHVQVECRGEVFDFEYSSSPGQNKNIDIASFSYSKNSGITFTSDASSNVVSKEKWGIKTNQFVKVKKIMLSPNHWQNNVGNKHYMFMLENCLSDEKTRPFFNEFLKTEFDEIRKVFEIMGAKLVIDPTPEQLSGVAFSETQRNHVFVRVDGTFKRILKINF